MTPETSTENRDRQPAFSAAGLLGAAVRIAGKIIGSLVCLVLFGMSGALYGIIFPWVDSDWDGSA